MANSNSTRGAMVRVARAAAGNAGVRSAASAGVRGAKAVLNSTAGRMATAPARAAIHAVTKYSPAALIGRAVVRGARPVMVAQHIATTPHRMIANAIANRLSGGGGSSALDKRGHRIGRRSKH